MNLIKLYKRTYVRTYISLYARVPVVKISRNYINYSSRIGNISPQCENMSVLGTNRTANIHIQLTDTLKVEIEVFDLN